MNQPPVQHDDPQVIEDVQQFLASFFANGGSSPTFDNYFLDQARNCQYDQSKWDKFIDQNISLNDRKSFILRLKQWIAKGNKTNPIEQGLSLILFAYNQVLSSDFIVKLIRQPELNDQPLKELDASVKKRLVKAVQSKTYIKFLEGQLENILKIHQTKSSLYQYFKQLQLSILGKHHLPLYNLFNEMTFTDFLIILQSAQKKSSKISKYLFLEQRTQVPTIYEASSNVTPLKQEFIKYVKNLIENQQYVLILNIGSQRTRRSGKTQFLTKLVELDEHYIQESSFLNSVNLYSKFKFSNENRLILADFNGAYKEDSKTYLRGFVQMASVLILHLNEDDLSEDNIFEQIAFNNLLIDKKWEKIIILVRDFEKQTEKYLRSKVPLSLKDKVKLCCLPNFENPPKGLKRSYISQLQNKAIEAFRGSISTMETVESDRKKEEEKIRRQLLIIYEQKKTSFTRKIQEKCQGLINDVRDWNVTKKQQPNNNDSIFNKLEQTCLSLSKALFEEFKKQTSSIWKKSTDLLYFQEEIKRITDKMLVTYFVACRRNIRTTDNQFKTEVDAIFNRFSSEAHDINTGKKNSSQEQIINKYKAKVEISLGIFVRSKPNATQIKQSDLFDPNITSQKRQQFSESLKFYRKVNRANLLKELFTSQNYAKIDNEDRLKIQKIMNQEIQHFQPELRLKILESVMSISSLYQSMNELQGFVQMEVSNIFKLIDQNFVSQLIDKVLKGLNQQRKNLYSYIIGMLLTIARSQIELRKTTQWQEANAYFNKKKTMNEVSLRLSLNNEKDASQRDKKANNPQNKEAAKIEQMAQIEAIQNSIKTFFSEYLTELNPSKMMIILEAQLSYSPNDTKQQLKRLYKSYYKYVKNQNRYLFQLLCKENAVVFRQNKIQLVKQEFSASYALRINQIIEILQKNETTQTKKILDKAGISFTDDKERIDTINFLIKQEIPRSTKVSDAQITRLINDSILNEFKNKAIGCDQQCPVCGVKCILPYGHGGDHKAKENSHQLIAFAGITDHLSNEFNFFICQSSPLMNKRLWNFQKVKEKEIETGQVVKINYKNAKQLISTASKLQSWNSDFPNTSDIQYHQSTDKLEFYKMIWANIQAAMITTKYRKIIPSVKQSTDPDILKYKQQNTFLTYSDLQEIEVDPFTEEDYKLTDF